MDLLYRPYGPTMTVLNRPFGGITYIYRHRTRGTGLANAALVDRYYIDVGYSDILQADAVCMAARLNMIGAGYGGDVHDGYLGPSASA